MLRPAVLGVLVLLLSCERSGNHVADSDVHNGPVPPWAEPVLAWNQDLRPDIGPVCAGSVAAATFSFQNVGPAALQITHIRTDCTCSSATADRWRVEPGESFSISIESEIPDTVASEQEWATDVWVEFAGQREPIHLGFTALAFRPRPAVIDLGAVTRGQATQSVFPLRSCDARTGPPPQVIPLDEHLSVALMPSDDPDTLAQVAVTLVAPHTPGAWLGQLQVSPAGGGARQVGLIPVRATIVPFVRSQPAYLSLGLVENGRERHMSVELISTTSTPFVIKSVRSTLAGMSTRWHPVGADATTYRVEFTLDPALHTPGPLTGEVVITIDHPQQSEVRVPVYGICR